MKENTLNQIIDYKIKLMFTPKKISFPLLKLFFLFSFCSISAQSEENGIPTIMEVEAYISSLNGVEQKLSTSFSNAQNVNDLIYKVQPSIYYTAGNVKTFGENPKNLYTDVNSLSGMRNANLVKKNIEIVIIKINNKNDLNSKIDLALFADFYKLKYIYIKSSITINEGNISKMFLNYDDQFSIFYKIEQGE